MTSDIRRITPAIIINTTPVPAIVVSPKPSSESSRSAPPPAPEKALDVAPLAASASSSSASRSEMEKVLRNAHIVFQSQCAVSRTQPLAFPKCGSSYCITAYDPKTRWTLLANTCPRPVVETVTECIESFRKLINESGEPARPLSQCRWRLIGGWKGASETDSEALGERLIVELGKNGVRRDQIDLSRYQKKTPSMDGFFSSTPNPHHYIFGGVLNPESGVISFFGKPWASIERENTTRLTEAWLAGAINIEKQLAREGREIPAAILVSLPLTIKVI